jgi:hypothetical protein
MDVSQEPPNDFVQIAEARIELRWGEFEVPGESPAIRQLLLE